MAGKKAAKENSKSDSVVFAFLATFLSIVGFIIALLVKKDDKYVMFYAKQSLVVFIVAIMVGFAQWILVSIPFFGWLVSMVLSLLIFVLWLVSWIYALSGKTKEVPVVGSYAGKINL